MRDDNVIVNGQDLDTIGDAMVYLSDSVDKVSSDINNINFQVDEFQKQINNMQNNVTSLEDEIKAFMNEMKKNITVTNAKQTIMISQMEYDKKYSHRDDVRRRVIGLLQAVDIKTIRKNTMENIGEETVVNNPDYWLAPALVALCYWYTDNKHMAQIALKKALERSKEKTSFLFCLIHLRANRTKTAIKWLNRYLSLQDPTDMDCKIVLLLDALSSGVFNQEISQILINQIDMWKKQLNAYPQYNYSQVVRWKKYLENKNKKETNIDNFVNDFVIEKDKINNVIKYSDFHMQVKTEFEDILNNIEYDSNNHLNKIDKLVNMLIFDYEEEELKLKIEIKKSNNIIKNNHDKIDDDYLLSYNRADLYTHITNMCLNDNIFDISSNTKKMAIALSKNNIIEAYQSIDTIGPKSDLKEFSITIANWIGHTYNGSNEEKLKEDLTKHVEENYQKDITKNPLLNKNMIISIVIGIIAIALFHKFIIIVLACILIVAIYNGYIYYNNYKTRQEIYSRIEEDKKMKIEILMCVLSEIVDYYFIHKDSETNQKELINYIDSLNYSDYIQTWKENKKRNIFIGGK